MLVANEPQMQRNLERAKRTNKAIDYGTVWWNPETDVYKFYDGATFVKKLDMFASIEAFKWGLMQCKQTCKKHLFNAITRINSNLKRKKK